ncbi:MAG: alpha/beta hydrolase [Hyphomicrobiaceae bacterium]|nr:alpha/beta hydrolase [Hyphomicrobiaceae bacterium]
MRRVLPGRWLGFLLIFALAALSSAATAAPRPDKAYRVALGVRGMAPVAIHAEEYGRGRPVLLIHGLAASTYAWRNVIPVLARTHRVIAIDLKGFGRSEKPFDLAYSPHDHAALVSAFIRKRGLTDVTVIGHSFGGAIALMVTIEMNRTAPGRVRDLVLMNAPAYSQPSTNFVNLMRMPILPYAVMTLVPPELATWLALDPAQAAMMTRKDVLEYAAPFRDAAARHALIATSRAIVPRDYEAITAAYPSIRQRTLVIWCREDPTVPLSTGKRLARTLPRARLEVLEGCSHVPQDEQPAAVNRLIRAFLN